MAALQALLLISADSLPTDHSHLAKPEKEYSLTEARSHRENELTFFSVAPCLCEKKNPVQ